MIIPIASAWLRYSSITALLLLAACSEQTAPDAAAPLPSDLSVIEIQSGMLAQERILDGVVSAVSEATLSAQTAARVIDLPFDVNDRVEQGEVVARLTDVEQQAGKRQASSALSAAQARAKEAEADYLRVGEIHQRGLVARAALDRAATAREASRADVNSARAALRDAEAQLTYTEVRAPYSGVLTQRHVRVGESVQPGQALISGLSTNKLRVEVSVPQADIQAIRELGKAWIEITPEVRVDAESLIIFPFADSNTHQQTVRIELDTAPAELQPGRTVKVHFMIGQESRTLIPFSSVLRQGSWNTVYLVREGKISPRQLRLGRRVGSDVEVITGLIPGDRIVTDYVDALRILDNGSRKGS